MTLQTLKRKMYVYKKDYKSFFDGPIDKKEVNRKKEKRKLTKKEFINRAEKVHGNSYDYSSSEYVNNETKIKIYCKTHNIYFKQTPTNHLSGYGCPNCSYKNKGISRGEDEIRKFLENEKLKYVFQKRFDDCKVKKTLIFDFYLPDLNMLIEYDGEQHFNVIDHWGGEESLKLRKKYDEIKNMYAQLNEMKMLRIPYYEFQNINEILKNNIILKNMRV